MKPDSSKTCWLLIELFQLFESKNFPQMLAIFCTCRNKGSKETDWSEASSDYGMMPLESMYAKCLCLCFSLRGTQHQHLCGWVVQIQSVESKPQPCLPFLHFSLCPPPPHLTISGYEARREQLLLGTAGDCAGLCHSWHLWSAGEVQFICTETFLKNSFQ